MSRQRRTVIIESAAELDRLMAATHSISARSRIIMLRMVQGDSTLKFSDIAQVLGRSVSTIKRWWRDYCDGGIETFIRETNTGTTRLQNLDPGLLLLRQKLVQGEFTTLDDVQQWLLGAASSLVHEPSYHADSTTVVIESEVLLRFVAVLPETTTVGEWSNEFRRLLLSVLRDVDRISVTVNAECDLRNPEAYKPSIAVVQQASSAGAVNSLSVEEQTDEHVERMLTSFRRQKFPFDQYRPPYGIVYYYAGTAYLGVIILWQERHRSGLSMRTQKTMQTLETFITFMMADAVRRSRVRQPMAEAFAESMNKLAVDLALTPQQRRVIILLAAGLTPDAVADTLHVTINTIRSHIRTIHNLANVRTTAELLGRYLTPMAHD